MVKIYIKNYSRISMPRTSLGPWEFVLDMGSSSHCLSIIAPVQMPNGDFKNAFSIVYKIMLCLVYSLESPS